MSRWATCVAVVLLSAGGAHGQDCNDNGIPDDCDEDCKPASLCMPYFDVCGQSLDCNINGVPDECDIADGTSPDDNGNNIPDECDFTRLYWDGPTTAAPGETLNYIYWLESPELPVDVRGYHITPPCSFTGLSMGSVDMIVPPLINTGHPDFIYQGVTNFPVTDPGDCPTGIDPRLEPIPETCRLSIVLSGMDARKGGCRDAIGSLAVFE